ncbi:hypothetical protein LEN26_001333 [Aphanomyces euteiches]|nr:hypothetical protein AeMF1_018576 [Aphanomyces euteiches]KAH9161639.1 hypothetical protein LEN26_001333 [Aphanomyces euteiches]KAH9190472.1 hypothetical protein AeNC1_007560 [Aphanomyces euteiches]
MYTKDHTLMSPNFSLLCRMNSIKDIPQWLDTVTSSQQHAVCTSLEPWIHAPWFVYCPTLTGFCRLSNGSVRAGRHGSRVTKYLETKFLVGGAKVNIIDPVGYNAQLLAGRFDEYPDDKKPQSVKAFFVPEVVQQVANHGRVRVVVFRSDKDEWLYSGVTRTSCWCCYILHEQLWCCPRCWSIAHALVAGLGSLTFPLGLPFQAVHTLLNEDGTLSAEAGSSGELLEDGAKKFAGEMVWFAEALQAKRATGLP